MILSGEALVNAAPPNGAGPGVVTPVYKHRTPTGVNAWEL